MKEKATKNRTCNELKKEVELKKISEVIDIIDLSGEEYIVVQNAISRYLTLDKECVIATEREIKDSIERTQKLRQEIENCNIDGIQKYLHKKTQLVQKANELNQKMQEWIDRKQCYKDALEEKKIFLSVKRKNSMKCQKIYQ